MLHILLIIPKVCILKSWFSHYLQCHGAEWSHLINGWDETETGLHTLHSPIPLTTQIFRFLFWYGDLFNLGLILYVFFQIMHWTQLIRYIAYFSFRYDGMSFKWEFGFNSEIFQEIFNFCTSTELLWFAQNLFCSKNLHDILPTQNIYRTGRL